MTPQLDERALRALINAFPHVPVRVVAAILQAYLGQCDTAAEAVAAARLRIADACAPELPAPAATSAA